MRVTSSWTPIGRTAAIKCRPPKSWKDVRFDNLPTTLILLPWPPEATWKAWQVDLQVRERAELLGGAGRLCAEVPALGGRGDCGSARGLVA